MPKNQVGPNFLMDVAGRPLASEKRPDLEGVDNESSVLNLKAHLHAKARDLRLNMGPLREL